MWGATPPWVVHVAKTFAQPSCFFVLGPRDVGYLGAFSHSTCTAPIITLFIPGTPLKTTHLQRLSVCTACALRVHCVRTACILRAQRLGYSPKNTCHVFTRGKTERCQYHRVG